MTIHTRKAPSSRRHCGGQAAVSPLQSPSRFTTHSKSSLVRIIYIYIYIFLHFC